ASHIAASGSLNPLFTNCYRPIRQSLERKIVSRKLTEARWHGSRLHSRGPWCCLVGSAYIGRLLVTSQVEVTRSQWACQKLPVLLRRINFSLFHHLTDRVPWPRRRECRVVSNMGSIMVRDCYRLARIE